MRPARSRRSWKQSRKRLAKQTALSRDYLETARRVQAEFENYKKRAAKERETVLSCANERLLSDLLIIYDDLQRALEAECLGDELRDGVSKIYTNLTAFLRENGIREIPVGREVRSLLPGSSGCRRGRGRNDPGGIPERILPRPRGAEDVES